MARACGRFRMATRLAKFDNAPELWRLLASFVDIRLDTGQLKLPVPRVAGGGPQNIVVEASDELGATSAGSASAPT
jgi:hypothetical protein